MQEETCRWIVAWFASRRKFTGDGAQLINTNYFEAGWLTSMEVVELVSEIEDKFGIQFAEEDFQDSRFATMAGLSHLVEERAAQSSQRR